MRKIRVGAAFAVAVLSSSAAVAAEPPIDLSVGGYVKLDVLYSRFGDGTVDNSIARDFYVPGLLPTGGESYDVLDFHAKQTRLWAKGSTRFDNGDTVGVYVETDFISTGSLGGDERVTNAYTVGLRRAFLTYNDFLFGQDWTTFQNLDAMPESVDFIGPTEGTVFGRQPQVRYTHGGFQVALENPETTVTPYGGGARVSTGDNVLPDLVLRWNLRVGAAQLALAALGRQLAIDESATDETPAADDKEIGYGASLSGKLPLGRDDVRFMLTGGDGIGRYVGINTANDAGVDDAGALDNVGLVAGFFSYRHLWTEQLRSSITYSQLQVDNDTGISGSAVTESSRSVHVNLMVSPVKPLTFGVEYTYGKRELEDGSNGDLNRVQLMAQYTFTT